MANKEPSRVAPTDEEYVLHCDEEHTLQAEPYNVTTEIIEQSVADIENIVQDNMHPVQETMLQRLYFVESLQKTLVHKKTYTKNKFSMGVY